MSKIISLAANRAAVNTTIKKYRSLIPLSFIEDGTRMPNGSKRNFWSVTPSDKYGADCESGGQLALEYLAYMKDGRGAPPLQWIVADMVSNIASRGGLSGLEVGFLGTLGRAAAMGACACDSLAIDSKTFLNGP